MDDAGDVTTETITAGDCSSVVNENQMSPSPAATPNGGEEEVPPTVTGVEGHVQQIVVPSEGTSADIDPHDEVDGASGEPATKKIRVLQEDGQILVLAVSEQEANQLGTTHTFPSELGTSSRPNLPSANTDVNQAWFTKKGEKSALHQTGHSWKQGQWSKDEVDILQSNIAVYCKARNISDPTEIIFEMNKDERKDFYRCIAQGLERPLFSVYRRVIRMYDQKNYMGKYTPDEIEKLKELRRLHGSDWATIGAAMGRSASSVKDRCRLMKDTCMTGKWLPSEEKLLADAVYELSGVNPGETVTNGLSWSSVAERVGTRSEKQCRSKWLNYLNWKQTGGTEWTREDDVNLVLKVAESGVTDETQLDWVDLAKNWSSVRSPQWLRGKWWSLKRHCPDGHLLPFTEIVKQLTVYHSQNVRTKSMSMRFAQLPRVSVMSTPGLTLQVPVAVAAGGNNTLTSLADVNAYELIPHEPTSGTYLITQPQNNPAISFTTSNMSTDHIIVHTLPVVSGKNIPLSLQEDGYHDNDAIQSIAGSTMQHVVISSDEQTTPELHLHIKDGQVGDPVGEMMATSNGSIGEIIATSQESYQSVESVITTTSSPSPASMTDDPGSLVINTADESETDETSKTANRGLIMSSLSDPMLASEPDNSELMESTCEVEGEKLKHDDS